MKRYVDYQSIVKYLKDSGFGLNKTIIIPDEPLLNRFEYWAKGEGEYVYLLEVLDGDNVFLFKLV